MDFPSRRSKELLWRWPRKLGSGMASVERGDWKANGGDEGRRGAVRIGKRGGYQLGMCRAPTTELTLMVIHFSVVFGSSLATYWNGVGQPEMAVPRGNVMVFGTSK